MADSRIMLLLAGAIVCAANSAAAEALRCDTFEIQAALEADELVVSLDTDCPEFAQLMVSVSRSYYTRGDSMAYAHDYFQQKSTVGDWRQQNHISVAHSIWESALNAHREQMSRLGMGYVVDRISDDVEIRMVIPVNQEDERFGKRNENLVGRAVRTTGLRVVEDEVHIRYPLGDVSLGKTHIPSTDPNSLEIARAYRISRETPLMSELNPADPMKAISETHYIPEGYVIKILSASKMHGNPWYKVEVMNRVGVRVGSGWVNSIALLGQKLEAIE